MHANASIDFTIGSRRLLAVSRALTTWSFSLAEVLALGEQHGDAAGLPEPPDPGPDGLRVLSAPRAALDTIASTFPGHVAGSRQDYRRHFIAMEGSYSDYLAQFSSKTRSTLQRKARKLARETGGYEVTRHASAGEVAAFLDAALPLSARTYQARLLDAGLPDTTGARLSMLEAAEDDRLRCFLLWAKGEPIAYLALPVTGTTVVYAHVGHDPEFARLSPGTVLQCEALEALFAEQRFTHFDFTEGEGSHKAMFGTASADCASFVLLTPTAFNRTLVAARTGFDAAVAGARTLTERTPALARIRSLLRA
ncbi:GNAT family N-acetyltransferase [Qipengyuania nanhaisediminis]|uniref:GNAT family N-acetyltransferase n=1 Tax=Qipengyuania nanhaisediminis TaxID=604088 RepID=UPI0038B3ADEC